jgi:glucosamine-6-phosphate deaminase
MYKHFFSHVDILPQNINILDGTATDPVAECASFEARIARYGGIELFLGGVGPDGHIAFNEPGSSLNSRTRVKTLAYDTILANSRFFGGDTDKVPRMAMTVGIQTIMDSREVVIVATGAHKAFAVQKGLEDGVNHMWTLSALQRRHSRAQGQDRTVLRIDRAGRHRCPHSGTGSRLSSSDLRPGPTTS